MAGFNLGKAFKGITLTAAGRKRGAGPPLLRLHPDTAVPSGRLACDSCLLGPPFPSCLQLLVHTAQPADMPNMPFVAFPPCGSGIYCVLSLVVQSSPFSSLSPEATASQDAPALGENRFSGGLMHLGRAGPGWVPSPPRGRPRLLQPPSRPRPPEGAQLHSPDVGILVDLSLL